MHNEDWNQSQSPPSPRYRGKSHLLAVGYCPSGPSRLSHLVPILPPIFAPAVPLLKVQDELLAQRALVHGDALLGQLALHRGDEGEAPAGAADALVAHGAEEVAHVVQEVTNVLFCPSHEKFHTVVSEGVGNISDPLSSPPLGNLSYKA